MADPEAKVQNGQPNELVKDPESALEGSEIPSKGMLEPQPEATKPLQPALDPSSPVSDVKEAEVESPRRDAEELSEGTKISASTEVSTEETSVTSEPISDQKKDGSGVRQKLQETSIAGVPESPEDLVPEKQAPENDDERGRLRRKRSFDESREDEGADAEERKEDESVHRRKRSRSSKAEDEPDQTEKQAEEPKENRERTPSQQRVPSDDTGKILSPKKKRSRDQLDKDDQKAEKAENDSKAKELAEEAEKSKVSPNNRTPEGEPEKKRHRDESQERDAGTKASLPNPFANTSATSPFAGLQASKSTESTSKDEPPKPNPVTSASAFASSGLAAFAGSEKSPFGAVGSGASIFKTMKPIEEKAGEKDTSTSSTAAAAAPSPFAAATGASPFSLPGGFASSAFASFSSTAPQTTSRLSSFASPAGTVGFGGGSKAKPLGAVSDNEEEEEEQAKDEARPAFEGLEEVKEDERFFKQQIETGEENEKTWCSCRGKLFQFDGKEWKERGIGTFKINSMESVVDSEGTGKPKKVVNSARMIMRTDGVLRVVLNSPIFKGMKVGDADGNEPTGKQINLAGIENGKSMPFLLRTSNAEIAKEIYHSIHAILAVIS